MCILYDSAEMQYANFVIFARVGKKGRIMRPFIKEFRSNMSSNPKPKLLYSFGRSLFIITHYFCGKAKQLPFPFGQLAASVEDAVGSRMLPPIMAAEGHCLHLLMVVDDQLGVIEGIAGRIFPPVSVLFDKAQKLEDVLVQTPDILVTNVDKLANRGLVGSIADLWIKHEADLKDRTDKLLKITQKVPVLSSVGTLVNVIGSPLAGMVSSWMLKHSEVEVKEVSFDNGGVKDVTDDTEDGSKQGSGNECPLLEKYELLVGTNNNTVAKGDQNPGKTVQEDNGIPVKGGEQSGKTVQEDDNTIIEENRKGKGISAPPKIVEIPADPILELFDTSWHMSPSIISPKSGVSPKFRPGK